MAIKNLNNIGYVYPVERVSRKFALRKEKLGIVPYRAGVGVKITSGFMGGSVRKVRVDGSMIERNVFWIKKNYRTSPKTQREFEIKTAFVMGTAWVREAQSDLSAISQNQEKWSESLHTGETIKGYSARNYTTMNGWMSAIAIKMRLNGETLPTNHLLPDFDA